MSDIRRDIDSGIDISPSAIDNTYIAIDIIPTARDITLIAMDDTPIAFDITLIWIINTALYHPLALIPTTLTIPCDIEAIAPGHLMEDLFGIGRCGVIGKSQVYRL